MKRMGIYWMPIYEVLEDAFAGDIILLVVNARHMKNISDKKVDMRDSEWFPLLRAGLLNGSFIAEKRARSSAIWTVTIRASSAISHPRKTGLRSSCKISVSVCPLLFLAFWHFEQEHHPAPNWAWADKLGGLYSCLKTKTRNRIDKILMFATLPMRGAT